ncbi:MAG: MarR family transcriptional regulator [Sutterellaceae bacterium]|nr:MarR family transcriptional regulator [Sutterellaceae bacterium]MDD7442362.1 MarR family transcriptional regulator [Sutterellaceae bacterium]MDY2867996.1 MarR family transcriptional regulator [Mesosutterella sp.]
MTNTKIVWLSSRLVDRANRYLHDELVREGYSEIAPGNTDVLLPLFERDGQSVSEIARAACRTKSTVSVMIDRLEKLGYVRKGPNGKDSRAVAVFLTEKGLRYRNVAIEIGERLSSKVLQNIRPWEAEAVEEFMARMIGNLSEGSEGPCAGRTKGG